MMKSYMEGMKIQEMRQHMLRRARQMTIKGVPLTYPDGQSSGSKPTDGDLLERRNDLTFPPNPVILHRARTRLFLPV